MDIFKTHGGGHRKSDNERFMKKAVVLSYNFQKCLYQDSENFYLFDIKIF